MDGWCALLRERLAEKSPQLAEDVR